MAMQPDQPWSCDPASLVTTDSASFPLPTTEQDDTILPDSFNSDETSQFSYMNSGNSSFTSNVTSQGSYLPQDQNSGSHNEGGSDYCDPGIDPYIAFGNTSLDEFSVDASGLQAIYLAPSNAPSFQLYSHTTYDSSAQSNKDVEHDVVANYQPRYVDSFEHLPNSDTLSASHTTDVNSLVASDGVEYQSLGDLIDLTSSHLVHRRQAQPNFQHTRDPLPHTLIPGQYPSSQTLQLSHSSSLQGYCYPQDLAFSGYDCSLYRGLQEPPVFTDSSPYATCRTPPRHLHLRHNVPIPQVTSSPSNYRAPHQQGLLNVGSHNISRAPSLSNGALPGIRQISHHPPQQSLPSFRAIEEACVPEQTKANSESDALISDIGRAWTVQQNSPAAPQRQHPYRPACGSCGMRGDNMLQCTFPAHREGQRKHWHSQCIGARRKPKDKHWMCPECIRAQLPVQRASKRRAESLIKADAKAEKVPQSTSEAELKISHQERLTGARLSRGKSNSWNPEEEAACIYYMKAIKTQGNYDRVDQLWEDVSDAMARHGMHRTGGGVKNAWNRWLRAQSGFDERAKPRPEAMRTGLLKNRSAAARREEDEADAARQFRNTAPKRTRKRRHVPVVRYTIDPDETEIETATAQKPHRAKYGSDGDLPVVISASAEQTQPCRETTKQADEDGEGDPDSDFSA